MSVEGRISREVKRDIDVPTEHALGKSGMKRTEKRVVPG